jgi:hypothetical protein
MHDPSLSHSLERLGCFEHRRDPSVSIAAVLTRQLDDVFCEYFLVCGWMACVSLC